MKRIILLVLLIPALTYAQRYGHTAAGGTFVWSVSGEATASDSLRIIEGSNMTITQSGNTITFGASASGSTGRTAWYDTDGDSVVIQLSPQHLYYLQGKDGTTLLFAVDSLGRVYSGTPTGTSIVLDPTSANNASIYFREAADNANDFIRVYFDGANNRLIFDGTENDAGDPAYSFRENVIIGEGTGNPIATLQLTESSSGANYMIVHNSSTGDTGTDGVQFGIDASEEAMIWVPENQKGIIFGTNASAVSNQTATRMRISENGQVGIGGATNAQNSRALFNVVGRASSDTVAIFSNDGDGVVGDSTVMIRASGNIQSGARAGFGVATSGQAARAILNVSGFSDTLAVFIGDANKAPGDSSTIIRDDGSILIRGASPSTTGLSLVASGQIESAVGFRTSANAVTHTGSGSAYKFASNNIHLDPAGANQVLISPTAPATQAYVTIRNYALADTLWMARNDVNSTLDSTAMVFADGSGYFGGNNLYLGGHRIRSNAAGDSLIFYDGTTMIFAILSDGSTADLVAGTPPTSRRYIPPPDYIWLLRIGVLLLLLLVAFKIYDYLKPFIRNHKTLPGEI